MSTQQEDNDRFIAEAKKLWAVAILNVLDTFDYSHYPVYCMTSVDLEYNLKEYTLKSMQRIDNVIIVCPILNKAWIKFREHTY